MRWKPEYNKYSPRGAGISYNPYKPRFDYSVFPVDVGTWLSTIGDRIFRGMQTVAETIEKSMKEQYKTKNMLSGGFSSYGPLTRDWGGKTNLSGTEVKSGLVTKMSRGDKRNFVTVPKAPRLRVSTPRVSLRKK